MTDEDPMVDWQLKMEAFCHLDSELKVLRQGATSSAAAMYLMSLKKRYKKIMGIND